MEKCNNCGSESLKTCEVLFLTTCKECGNTQGSVTKFNLIPANTQGEGRGKFK